MEIRICFELDVVDPPFVKDRLGLLLDYFGAAGNPREACKVRYPLHEVLLLVTCASIAGCDDYDEIAKWGDHHLGFLRRHGEYRFGTPKEDWLWVALAQKAVDTKDNECAAILGRLDIKGAPVTIAAIATNPTVARAIVEAGGDYVLALKRNQPTLQGEVEACFADPATSNLPSVTATDKDHGRIETWVLDVTFKEDLSRLRRGRASRPRLSLPAARRWRPAGC